MDHDAPRMSESDQQMAAMDGQTGQGGCAHCDADYKFIHVGLGLAHLRIRHEVGCPALVARLRGGFMTNTDPGDEQ